MVGITIDTVEGLDSVIAKIAEANLPYRLISRLVCDPGMPPSSYDAAIDILSIVSDIVIQPVDSSEMGNLSTEEYVQRMDHYMANLRSHKAVKYFEVGNEINGDWCGSNVRQKVNKSLLVAQTWGVKTFVTYYMVDAADPANSRPEFWLTHYALTVPPDFIALSCYPHEEQFLTTDILKFFANAQKYYPDSSLGIGEWGTEGIQPILNSTEVQEEIRGAYKWCSKPVIEPPISNWEGGVFWWDAVRDIDLLLPILKGLEA